MSIEFSSSYPANPVSTGKPVDVQTLQETFAAVLRSYGIDKGGMQTSTMLEVLQSASPTDNAGDRSQQRRDDQQHANRNDFTQIDRKLLDKSEIRHGDMNSDYRDRVDRQESNRNDYQARVERSELQQSASQATVPNSTSSASLPLDNASLNELPPDRNDSRQQKNVSEIAGTNGSLHSVGVVAPNSATVNGSAGSAMPMGVNVPIMPLSPISQVVPPQTFTIFTASGRFGQLQEKPDEKESDDEKEESVEKKPAKKKQPFAMFEAIQAEATRPTRRNHARQPQEPLAQTTVRQATEKLREKPKKSEAEQPRNVQAVKTLEEFLNVPQNVVVSKKEETQQPNQTQYLHRIAAACEAAAHYAPIRIKVNLDHLGTLTLRFFYQSDKLMLRFETPSKESARLLHGHLDGLRTILSKRNVRLESVEVFLTEDANSK